MYSEDSGIPHDVTELANTTARRLCSVCWILLVEPCAVLLVRSRR